MSEKDDIRDLVESWAIWRDALDWERFRAVWHDDGIMVTSWWQGPFEDYVTVSDERYADGLRIMHFLGGCAIEVDGDRAIAQTKMTISLRDEVHGIECDVVATGRFYDFFERRDGRWGLVMRQPIYERDRIDPVDPAAVLHLDAERLGGYPRAYRHLAYLHGGAGHDVKPDLPGLTGPEVQALYSLGDAWLAGEAFVPASAA